MISFNKASFKNINLILFSIILLTLAFTNFSIQTQEIPQV